MVSRLHHRTASRRAPRWYRMRSAMSTGRSIGPSRARRRPRRWPDSAVADEVAPAMSGYERRASRLLVTQRFREIPDVRSPGPAYHRARRRARRGFAAM